MLENIQNMTGQELKSKRDVLIAEAQLASLPELAARYVQSLTDAKLRDEKLGEQGREITGLNETINVQSQALRTLESELSAKNKTVDELQQAVATLRRLNEQLESREAGSKAAQPAAETQNQQG
jgi:hypothetical protein